MAVVAGGVSGGAYPGDLLALVDVLAVTTTAVMFARQFKRSMAELEQ